MAGITDGLIDRALSLTLARTLDESGRARVLLSLLEGRRIRVELKATPWSVTVACTGTQLRTLSGNAAASTDSSISGAPLSLLALMGDEPQAVIQRGDVRIEGDAEVAQQFRELAALLRPDLEHSLSRLIGRSGAHVLTRGLRGAAQWTRTAARTALQNVAEYLAHERGDLVSRAEAEQFLRGVDDLREQLDRIEARLAVLTQRMRQLAGGQEPA